MRTTTLMLLVLLTAGCGQARHAAEYVGITKSAAQLETEKAEADAKAKADKAKLFQEMKDADALTTKWLWRLDVQPGHHQGVTELDPWGNMVLVEYRESGMFNESVTVTSMGPDGVLNTEDDIWHIRLREYPRSFVDSVMWLCYRVVDHPLGQSAIAWCATGAVGLVLTAVKGKHRRKKHPVASGSLIFLISPIIVVCYAAMFAIAIVAGLFDGDGDMFEGGFDFFDIDIDF